MESVLGHPKDLRRLKRMRLERMRWYDVDGNRMTLKWDSFIPATMAVIYLLILLYFKAIGGYKPVSVEDAAKA
jgi:hypothetical protein